MKAKILLFLFLWVNPILIFSQTEEIAVLSPNLKDDWEEWVTNRPVAGELRVGVMVESEKNLNKPEAIYVNKPAIDLEYICVQIKSVDGRYRANLAYPVDTKANGIIKLDFPTKHKAELSQYRCDQVSILAELKENCSGPAKYYLVAGWEPQFTNKNIVVYVNSRRPAKLVVVKDRKIIQQYPCKRFESNEKTVISYNKQCEFPFSDYNNEYRIFLRQSGNGPVSSPDDFPVPIILQ